MKIKHCLVLTPVLALLAAVLRVLQYLFIIDADGYYSVNNIFSYSVDAVLAVAIIAAAILMISGNKATPEFLRVFGGKSIGVICIALAATIMVISGINIKSPIMSAPAAFSYALGALGIITAIHYAVLGFACIKKVNIPALRVSGIVPPLYVVLYSICEFYSAFGRAHESQTILFMVSLCTITLFTASLGLASAKADVSARRIAACAMLCTVFTAVTGPAYLISMLLTGGTISATNVFAVILQAAFLLMALIVLIRLRFASPDDDIDDDDEDPTFDRDELDLFLDDIPDEDIPTEDTDE